MDPIPLLRNRVHSSTSRSAGVVGTSYASSPASSARRPSCRQLQLVAAVQSPPRPTQLRAPSSLHQPTTLEKLQTARLITAIKTPYLENGKFDLAAYDRLVEHQVHNGVEGLVIGGTTGEGQLMSWDEHIMLIAHTVNKFGKDILVIGNTGSNSTREALHATSQGVAVGMHAALHINPYYGKTSRAGLIRHFSAALDEGPAIIYNVPGRTGQDIPDDVVQQLAPHANFLGMKECTGNPRIQASPPRRQRKACANLPAAFQQKQGLPSGEPIFVQLRLPKQRGYLPSDRSTAGQLSLGNSPKIVLGQPHTADHVGLVRRQHRSSCSH